MEAPQLCWFWPNKSKGLHRYSICNIEYDTVNCEILQYSRRESVHDAFKSL